MRVYFANAMATLNNDQRSPSHITGTWINRQRIACSPGLDEELDPPHRRARAARCRSSSTHSGWKPSWHRRHAGRGHAPPDDRPAIARAVLSPKPCLHHPHHIGPDPSCLQIDRALRLCHICGWERPLLTFPAIKATFSRAFAEFAAQNLPGTVCTEQLVRRHLRGSYHRSYLSRDATEIEAREKPAAAADPPDDSPPP